MIGNTARIGCWVAAFAVLTSLSASGTADGGPRATNVGRQAIKLEFLWSVGDAPGEEEIVCTIDAMLAASSDRERFYIGPTCARGQVAVLGAGGNVTGYIGTLGDGLGELGTVGTIFVDPRDQLHIFQFPRRHSVFTAAEGRFVRSSQTLPLPGWVLFLSDGTSIRNLMLRTPARVGKPLHIVDDSTDELLLSFGENPKAVVQSSSSRDLFRSVASGGDGSYWSARPFDYTLEQWDARGYRLRTIERNPTWWITKPGYGSTWMRDIRVGGNFIWTVSMVPTFDGEFPGNVGSEPGLNAYFDSVIEVVALDTEDVVATNRSPIVFSRWVDDLVFSHRDSKHGAVAMDVWRVHISGSRDPGQ